MALVTTCPHCATSFRIVADQLKLRGGLVRCGSCLAVFSGLEKMQRLDDAKPGQTAARRTGPARPSAGTIDSAGTFEDASLPPHARAAAGEQAPTPDGGLLVLDDADTWDDDGPLPGQIERRARLPDLPPVDDVPPLGRLTPASNAPDVRASDAQPRVSEADRAAFERAKAERAQAERARLAREDLREAARDIDADDGSEMAIGDEEMAIDYFSTEQRRLGFLGQHAVLKLSAAGFLVLALAVQAVLADRDWLAARLPALEPAIAALATPFGLTIAPPRALDALSIESFELQADAASELLAVSAIIHNAAAHVVRWPSMMLTLTDTQNRVLVRKAIDPADYLGASVDAALRPNSERPIRLALEARGLHPAGYSVDLFYR